jgi:hypothetical protein
MSSVAQNIATQVNARLGITWVTPAVVQTLLALSKPVRVGLYQFLASQEATLSITQGKFQSWSRTGDVLAEKLTVLSGALSTILEQVDRVLAAVPLDSIAKESPKLAQLLQGIADSVPLAIPAPIAQAVVGLTGEVDFFEGISSYKDLRAKIDEFSFRLARATAFSNYASQIVTDVEQQREQVRAYMEIINLLND